MKQPYKSALFEFAFFATFDKSIEFLAENLGSADFRVSGFSRLAEAG